MRTGLARFAIEVEASFGCRTAVHQRLVVADVDLDHRTVGHPHQRFRDKNPRGGVTAPRTVPPSRIFAL